MDNMDFKKRVPFWCALLPFILSPLAVSFAVTRKWRRLTGEEAVLHRSRITAVLLVAFTGTSLLLYPVSMLTAGLAYGWQLGANYLICCAVGLVMREAEHICAKRSL